MKRYLLFIISIAALAAMTGCEYDVAEPPWEKDFVNPPTPVITGIEPADVATAGVNTITILGENFAGNAADNKVYFDNIPAEIVNANTTSITVRRPNLVTDSSDISVISYDAIVAATYGPYKINPVMERYGEFLDNNQLTGLFLDDEENLYVLQPFEYTVYMVPPGGAKIDIGSVERTAYDLTMAPDGKLVIAFNQRYLNKFDIDTGQDTLFLDLPKRVSFCDYDDNGILYTIGRKTDLIIIMPDSSNSYLGVYANYIITDMRVYNNYVYIVGENTSAGADEAEFGVWRHEILDANGTLGPQQLMFDWAAAGDEFVDSEPTGIAVTADGTMYVSSDNDNPILIVTPDGQFDVFYKDIIPSHAVKLVGGQSNYLYMLLGTEEYNIVRIDIGSN